MASSRREWVSLMVPTSITAHVVQPLAPDVISLVTVAMENVRLLEALRYFAPSGSWANLYKALEVVQDEIGGDIHRKGWASKRELDRFTQTANSTSAVGRDARHAKRRFTPPKRPMSLEEADELIRNVLMRW